MRPVIALGRGGAAETVDSQVGRLYSEPGSASLEAAIESWEAEGHPHDPIRARQIAESYALPVFRDRILGLLAEVSGRNAGGSVPPRPHVDVAASPTRRGPG